MTGDVETIELYNRAIDRLVRFHPDIVELSEQLTTTDEPAPMALVLAAYLGLMSTDPNDLEPVRTAVESLSHLRTNDREKAHCRGDRRLAGGRLERSLPSA